MNQAEYSARLRALNREGRTFWRAVEGRFEKLIQERPDILKCAIQEMADYEARGAFRFIPSLEHIAFRIAGHKAPPRRRGRPRQRNADLRKRIDDLRESGHSWPEVSQKLAEVGIHLSVGGCRYQAR